MSNFPISSAVRTETIGLGTGTGTAVTASASADTKGSYATIGTAGFEYSGFVLSMLTSGLAGGTKFRLDIAVNTGGSDTIIVGDYYFESSNTVVSVTPLNIYLPVRIPSGATVKARVQASSGNRSVVVSLIGVAYDFPGFGGKSRIVSCTDFAATLPTNTVTQTGTSYTAWTEIRSSLPARITALWLTFSQGGDATRTSSDFIVDIGVGAAGSEVVIGSILGTQSGGIFSLSPAFLPCDIPAGKRLAFRIQCAAAGAADAFGVCAMGLAA